MDGEVKLSKAQHVVTSWEFGTGDQNGDRVATATLSTAIHCNIPEAHFKCGHEEELVLKIESDLKVAALGIAYEAVRKDLHDLHDVAKSTLPPCDESRYILDMIHVLEDKYNPAKMA